MNVLLIKFYHKLGTENRSEWANTISAYLKERSRKKVFLLFMATEAGIAGLYPSISSFYFKNSDCEFFVKLDGLSEWLSAIIAVVIAVGYYIYLYMSTKKEPQYWNKIVEAARIISDNFTFNLTKEWFSQQNDKGIRELGNRYSEEVNFPFEDMPWLLSALRIEDGFNILIKEDLNDFADKARYFAKSKNDDNDDLRKLREKTDDVLKCLYGLNEDARTYDNARNEVNALNELFFQYRTSQALEKRDYGFDSLRQESEKLYSLLCNQWIGFKKSKVWFIVGPAGTGKSHLIGDIVRKRQRNAEPSILLLGEKFNKNDAPLAQIANLLDYPGKKELLLRDLNNYGKSSGNHVVLFVDGLNEKDGEDFWSAHLIGLIDDIERFDYLRLVVSFRISGAHNWFYDMAYNHPEFTVYHHKGFEGKEELASEFIFGSFGLDQPLWPAYGSEFANPLFLIKYCKVHKDKGTPLEYESFWTTILQYCDEINHDMAIRFHYDDSLHLVTNALKAIAELMVETTGRWYLEYDKAIEILTEVAKYTNKPHEFLRWLVDDGILRTDCYKGSVYVDYGFERVGDYFLADSLLDKGKYDLDGFHKYGSGVEDAIAVLAPLKTGKEFFELVSEEHKNIAFHAFIDSAAQRDVFTEKGQLLLKKMYDNGYEQRVLEIILQRPFRKDENTNSSMLYRLLWGMSMKERDALWTIKISEVWGLGKYINELAMWAMNASDRTLSCVDIDRIRLCSEALVWSLASTWRELRDRATHALVKILSVRKELALPLLQKYYDVNDLYIKERLWASMMGCVVCAQSVEFAKEIASWTYKNLFVDEKVPVHILIRDYARSIIRYAHSLGADLEIDEKVISLPLSKESIPDHIMSCDDVKAKYDIEWDKVKDDEEQRDLHIANYRILSSMATEHSPRTSMYGDFDHFNTILSDIFLDNGYDGEYSSTDKVFDKNEFVKMLNLRICPYCGRAFIYSVQQSGRKTVVKPQIDHFLPKSIYPFFALSYMNLIPSCQTCNMKDCKGSHDTIQIAPADVKYLIQYPYMFDGSKIKFEYLLKGTAYNKDDNFKVVVDYKGDKLLQKGYNYFLKTEEFYKFHHVEVAGMYRQMMILASKARHFYKELGIKKIWLNPTPMMMLGFNFNEENEGKYMLYKFKKDIFVQMMNGEVGKVFR